MTDSTAPFGYEVRMMKHDDENPGCPHVVITSKALDADAVRISAHLTSAGEIDEEIDFYIERLEALRPRAKADLEHAQTDTDNLVSAIIANLDVDDIEIGPGPTS